MGYFSCNAESAIGTCDPYNWHLPSPARRRKKKTIDPPPNPDNYKTATHVVRHFPYSDLVQATDSFSADAFLGKGSHGSVYKATLDGGALVAAVKKPTSSSSGDNELDVLSKVPPHPNLVNLIGFASSPSLLLVVEYMPNGSLHDHLHSSSLGWEPPGWARRVRFALHVARAVQALHAASVIHRDIKSSNVLIDAAGDARLADFGLALRAGDSRSRCTPPAGTLGYLDPAYLAPGDLTAKSDVFSFGILLLEIVSGRKAIDVDFSPPSVVDWAIPLIRKGELGPVFDARVGFPGEPVARELAGLAARCVRSCAEGRPGMAEVMEVLKAINKRVRRHAPRAWRRLMAARRVEDTRGNGEVARVGNRRGSSKVSSLPVVESGAVGSGHVVGRSRSIGSGREVAAVKVGRRLSKSRSTGPLRRGHVAEVERGVHLGAGGNGCRVLLDDRKMQEVPLVPGDRREAGNVYNMGNAVICRPPALWA